jgi:hypothetical protein
MGFLDNVKAAANDLKSSVDQQLSSSTSHRDVDKHFRDLGMLYYLKETGREIVQADWDRVLAELKASEAQGAIPTFALQTAAPPPPGAGATGPSAPPPPPSGMAPPPPPAAEAPAAPTPAPPPPPPPAGGVTPPPPPPPPPSS